MSKAKRSEIMSKIHEPTKLEETVHAWLCGRHISHEMYPKVEGRPDIFLKKKGLYVFVDGCFWHCCPIHYSRPKSNVEFWKVHVEESNIEREKRRAALPYPWIRIWEHEVGDGTFKERLS